MKQIYSRGCTKDAYMDLADMRTKISRAAFIMGIALMFVTFCMVTVPFEIMAITGISGSILTLASMWWTGWGDW